MINEHYFSISAMGLKGLLRELPLDECMRYVRNHLNAFLPDESSLYCFLDRLSSEPDLGRNNEAYRMLLYLLDKALQLKPFRQDLLRSVVNLRRNATAERTLAVVEQTNSDPEVYGRIAGMDLERSGDAVRGLLHDFLQSHPDHVVAAQYALHADAMGGIACGPWQEVFTCPLPLKRQWRIMLFNHYASLCAYDLAREVWPKVPMDMVREHTLNLAAEMFAEAGDVKTALECYEASLSMDPHQMPVALRKRALAVSFQADHALLRSCKVAVCLYSWNKADLLGQTLESLSRSDIGAATVHVLLNGCTDHSREVVEQSRALFPDNELVVHDLHVNIGAPAARNWLVGLPALDDTDYIAFLDDDVTVPTHWLAAYLTVAEADPQVGVVGGKIVEPGEPPVLQYLYRHVAQAGRGLLKLSVNAPKGVRDNNLYAVVRETRNVMGCLHLLRTSAARSVSAGFDIRFSPSQVDDMDHDLALCLSGYKVMYCGHVTCVHHQSSGVRQDVDGPGLDSIGSTLGNDIKFYFKHAEQLEKLSQLDNLSLELGVNVPEI